MKVPYYMMVLLRGVKWENDHVLSSDPITLLRGAFCSVARWDTCPGEMSMYSSHTLIRPGSAPLEVLLDTDLGQLSFSEGKYLTYEARAYELETLINHWDRVRTEPYANFNGPLVSAAILEVNRWDFVRQTAVFSHILGIHSAQMYGRKKEPISVNALSRLRSPHFQVIAVHTHPHNVLPGSDAWDFSYLIQARKPLPLEVPLDLQAELF